MWTPMALPLAMLCRWQYLLTKLQGTEFKRAQHHVQQSWKMCSRTVYMEMCVIYVCIRGNDETSLMTLRVHKKPATWTHSETSTSEPLTHIFSPIEHLMSHLGPIAFESGIRICSRFLNFGFLTLVFAGLTSFRAILVTLDPVQGKHEFSLNSMCFEPCETPKALPLTPLCRWQLLLTQLQDTAI
jgi:hypothetical protein